jgi:hypothetical protein
MWIALMSGIIAATTNALYARANCAIRMPPKQKASIKIGLSQRKRELTTEIPIFSKHV